MQSLVRVMQVVRLKTYVHCIKNVFVVNAVAKKLYFRYAVTRKSVVCGAGAGSKHAKISFVGTNGSGLSISRDSGDFSDDLELISDFEGNNIGIGGPSRQVQQR